MDLIKLIKNGQKYMQVCPKLQNVNFRATFPEIKIIRLTSLGLRFMPALSALIFFWQYSMQAPLILSLITIFFALSLPVQGLLWLGRRAQMPLPLTLVSWFNQLKHELIVQQIISEKIVIEPTFMELMKLLHLSKKHLGYYPCLHMD